MHNEGVNLMDDFIKPGDIVLSKAGRDKGRWFAVMRVEENYCLLADGDLRKIDKMKRKKIKHIKWARTCSEFIAGKLDAGEKVTNSEVRRALAEFIAEAGEVVEAGEHGSPLQEGDE